MPLTSNGKQDRKKLTKPNGKMRLEQNTSIPNVIEESLTRIKSKIKSLETENLGIDANFPELGSHSLKATSMTANIHKTFTARNSIKKKSSKLQQSEN